MGEAQKSEQKSGKTARRGRRIKQLLLGLVVLVLVLVALGPTIAGPIARPIVEGAVNEKIKGRAALNSLGLSWLGAQKVSLTLDDPEGGRVADVTVRADKGLLGLALGSRDLGIVYVRGSATVVRDADGSTNLQRAIEPRFPSAGGGGGGGEPAVLPKSLAASLVLDGLAVTYQDAAIGEQTDGKVGAVRLGALTGSVDFAVGKPLGVSIKGPIATGVDAGSLAESGSLALEVRVTGLTDAAGTVTPDAMGAEVSLALTAPALEVALHAGLADGAVVNTGETRVSLRTAELAELVPAVAGALAAQPGVRIGELPTLTVAVEDLRFPMDRDLRSASASLKLSTSAIAGSIDLPTGETTTTSPFGIEPLEVSVLASSLAETVTVRGGTRATIGEASAGSMSVDLAVGSLLDDTGAVRGMPGSIVGGLKVEGFSTPILQPFVSAVNTAMPAGLRLDLPEDVGPTLDLALSAESHTDSGGGYDIDLALDSERAEIDAAVVVEGQRIASRGDGVRVRLDAVAPILDRVSAAHGVRVDRGGKVTLQASEFAVDLTKLKGESGPDLRGVRAAFDFSLTDVIGQMQLAGDDTVRDFRLEELKFGAVTDDLAGEVRVTANAGGRLNGQPLGAMTADMTLAGLLDGDGRPRTGALPTLRGEARVDDANLVTIDRVFGSLYEQTGVELARDVGPAASVLLLAASNPAAGAGATDVDLTLRSSHVDLTAPLTLTPDRVRTREPITLVDRAAGESLGRLLAGEGPVAVRGGGVVRLTVGGLDLPLGAGGVRPDRVGASVTATLTDFAADVALASGQGAGSAERVEMPRLVATVTAAPGAPPQVGVEGSFKHGDQPFALSLASTLNGLFLDAPADAAVPMSVVSVAGLRPETSFSVTGIPATLARVVPMGMIKVGEQPLDTVLVARDTLGRTFDISASTSPSPNIAGATQLGLDVRGQGLGLLVRGRVDPGSLRLFRAEGRLGVTPRVARHMTDLLAASAPVTPALTKPAELTFKLDEQLDVPLGEGFKPDIASMAGELAATVTVDAALAELVIPAAEGKEGMVIPALAISGLTIGVKAPGAVVSGGEGRATATIGGRVLAADGSTVAAISGGAGTTLKDRKPTGAMPVNLRLTEVSGTWVDALLGKPFLVSGSVGEAFGLTVDADLDRLRRRAGGEPAVTLAVDSPRVSTSVPIALAINKQAVYLHESAALDWRMGPRWANRYLLAAPPGVEEPAFEFADQTPVRLELNRVGLAMGEGEGLFKPGVFIVNAAATVPELSGTLSDGRAMKIGGLSFRVGRGPTPDQLGFTLDVPRMSIGDGPELKPEKNRISGKVTSFADAAGNLTPDAARLDITGGISPIPTEVIDAFARQNGLLRDALGPTVDFSIDAQDFSKQGGTLRIGAVTPLANATITGEVRDGLFVIDPKASPISVSVITPELTKHFQKALPMVATFEKTREDNPLRVVFETPLELPLDGNMDRLNGKVTFDIGTARFGTESWFQKLLSVSHQKTAGEVGRRMPPLKLTIDKGLVSYEPYKLPFGEFTLETAGAINLSSTPRKVGSATLPSRELQVLTFIPTGAFAAEAVPALAGAQVPLLSNVSRLPVRTKGPIAKPANGIAVDLMGQELIETPGRLLQDLIGGGG